MDWAPFSSKYVLDLLHNKFVVIIGDSIQRGIYKDLVRLLQTDQFLEDFHLKHKGEKRVLNDKLIDGGCFGQMTNSKDYREIRQYLMPYHLVRFYFVTRCYEQYMETILAHLAQEPRPDIVIMNSCLWDISRYGPHSTAMAEYKTNLNYLCLRMKETLPDKCLFIWNTALPVGQKITGGFMTSDIKWMKNHLTYLVKEANFYAVQIMEYYGVDVKDLHYHFANPVQQLGRRVKDGIHWDPRAHRNITFMILRHICRAWDLLLFEQQRAARLRENQATNVLKNNAIRRHATNERKRAEELAQTASNSVCSRYNHHSQKSLINLTDDISLNIEQCISMLSSLPLL